jgi:hypothetical protein
MAYFKKWHILRNGIFAQMANLLKMANFHKENNEMTIFIKMANLDPMAKIPNVNNKILPYFLHSFSEHFLHLLFQN